MGIENCNTTDLNKKEFKQILIKACKLKDEEIIRKEAENNIKCVTIMKQKYGIKSYMKQQNINVAREHFRTRVMMHRFAGNYRHDPAFQRTGGLCRCGTAPEVERHLTSGECPTYRDIVEKFEDLTNEENLVRLFREILARRSALDEAVVASRDATDGRQPGGDSMPADLGT